MLASLQLSVGVSHITKWVLYLSIPVLWDTCWYSRFEDNALKSLTILKTDTANLYSARSLAYLTRHIHRGTLNKAGQSPGLEVGWERYEAIIGQNHEWRPLCHCGLNGPEKHAICQESPWLWCHDLTWLARWCSIKFIACAKMKPATTLQWTASIDDDGEAAVWYCCCHSLQAVGITIHNALCYHRYSNHGTFK